MITATPPPASAARSRDPAHEAPPSGGFTLDQQRLREQVCDLLAAPDTAAELAELGTGASAGGEHPWRLYRRLGSRGWLAPHWPVRFGGLGLGWIEAAIVAEELALHGVPDTAVVNGVYNVGQCLLTAGTPAQRERYLPRIAAGDIVAAVLLTEPDAGSDLADLATSAVPVDGGWTLSGHKAWNAQSQFAAVALCAARTGPGPGYRGISLFLVPMDAAGVTVTGLDTVNVETLSDVRLDGVRLPADGLLGEVGEGWPVLLDALALERAGLGYHGRARRWFDALLGWARRHPAATGDDGSPEIAVLQARISAGRELAWQAVRVLATAGPPATGTVAAMAKWYNTQVALEVLDLAAELGADTDPTIEPLFTAARREALGLTLAAGTSEMMLTVVHSDLHHLLALPR